VEWRRLNAPNVERLADAGVYYGATPDDLPDIAGQEVVVAGYGNSAGQAALELAKTASTVHLLARGDALEKRMSKYLIDDIEENRRIKVAFNTEVKDAEGSTRLSAVNVINNVTGEERRIATKHLLVFIGSETDTRWLSDFVALNERGHVLAGHRLEAEHPGSTAWAGELSDYATSTPNVWVVGDVRAGTYPRVLGAVGQAMNASTEIGNVIGEMRRGEPEFSGDPEKIRVRIGAETEEQAKALMELTLSSRGYQLVPLDEPNAWRLCQELGRVRTKLEHIANVRLSGKKHFYLNIEAPSELFIGSPEQRRRQALAWEHNIQAVLSERLDIRRQQQPPQFKGGVSLGAA
jgi:thioredoxin reductase